MIDIKRVCQNEKYFSENRIFESSLRLLTNKTTSKKMSFEF